jgi:hypothetical protein
MSFTSIVRELRRGILNMLGTHITMSLLIFRLIAILVLHLVLLLMLCLASFMNLTIAHMVLVHERTTLCLDALVTSHILIVVIVFRVGTVFLLEGTHVEPRHLDGPCFPHRGSHPTGSKGEVQKTVKTSSRRMIKRWITKIYLTNPNTQPSTSSHPM